MEDVQVVAGQPPAEDRGVLVEALLAYNRQATGIEQDEEFSTFIHDDAGALVAGMYGWVFGGAAEIALLWVREDRRGGGLGSRLLNAAEDHARRAGCDQMVIRTHSFQAPGFYHAHGYEDVGSIQDYPRGHGYLLLRKAL
jgi:GNAT superfamily N-acetyltransferase